MGYPRWLYNNLALAATITASAEDSGYPDGNLNGWRRYEKWMASGANSYTLSLDFGADASINSLGISGHNLYSEGVTSILTQYSDDDITYSTALAAFAPASDKTLAKFWTASSHRYWRITISNGGGANFEPYIGCLFLGTYLEFPEYCEMPFDPDRHGINSTKGAGETGEPLGESVDYRERRLSVSFNTLSRTWVKDTFLPIWDAHFDHPFIFVWDYESHAAEAYFVEFDMDEFTAPYDNVFRPVTLDMRGPYENA